MTGRKGGKIVSILCDTKKIEWKIPDFLSAIKDESPVCCLSPVFYFANKYWKLGLRIRPCRVSDGIHISLVSDSVKTYSVEYYLGFKKCDGSVKLFANGILKERETCTYDQVKKTFFERNSELVPEGVLTISCTLMLINEARNPTQHTAKNEGNPMKLTKLDKLSENFKSIFSNTENYDVTLKVKDKSYKAHKLVLIARSSVFAAYFKHDTLEKQTGVITIPDCDSDSFEKFLEYIYCGKLEQISTSSAINLYYTSDKYDVRELKDFCTDYLMQNLTVENIYEVAVFADKYDKTELYSAVQGFFNKNISDISETSEWEYLMQNNCRLANKLLKEMLKVKK